ncbi:N-acetylglucosaminephosphotransferase [Polyporus arcularius HHB13444]|uniref:UDP-N-acetylglucosamine--dolichyl-phosphate N-acetylglucosaminephosphotransferase n=1 Tax=Polyporus arcularius HHB13444 TaxID=1314778 RepID=A0A5C3PZB0_9APHY|nr:N-acetylglucosaminephosphotransferase [Polyporus arcularius HHB13444]
MTRETALRPRRLPKVIPYALLPTAFWFLLRPLVDPAPPLPALHASLGFSLLALLASLYLIPALGQTFIRANLKGRDLLKTYDTPIPESQGLICASIYIILLILFIPYAFSESITTHYDSARRAREGLVVDEFPHHQLAVYLSSLLSLLMATMLGFLDDVFDIRWRHKLPIPIIASIPLLIVYYSERGATDVVVPLPLRWLLGTMLHLGPLYYVYMSLLSTFCTNSINILAGINGSEVSQAVIIASSIILNDLLFLPWPVGFRIPLPLHVTDGVKVGGMWSAGMAYGSRVLVARHLFSLYLMLPLLGVCLGFMYHNWYPARAFPGDTLCYVAGMAFAVVGIQAHYSKTLLLFFLPQIFNFVLSCPQLFGLVPCPRHRVPRYDAETQLLHPSRAEFKDKRPSKLATLVLRLFSGLGLVELVVDQKTGEIESSTNLTILNVFLLRLGPMREDSLTRVLIATQVCSSLLAFFIRYGLAGLVYDGNRR